MPASVIEMTRDYVLVRAGGRVARVRCQMTGPSETEMDFVVFRDSIYWDRDMNLSDEPVSNDDVVRAVCEFLSNIAKNVSVE